QPIGVADLLGIGDGDVRMAVEPTSRSVVVAWQSSGAAYVTRYGAGEPSQSALKLNTGPISSLTVSNITGLVNAAPGVRLGVPFNAIGPVFNFPTTSLPTLCAPAMPPPNDTCAAAIPIALTDMITGTTAAATNDGVTSCGRISGAGV